MSMDNQTVNRTSLRCWFLIVFVTISVILVFLTAFTKYYFAKDYYFYVEAPCDETSELCFVRDCDDYCPPNGLASYKAYYIKASLFDSCSNNSCTNICSSEATSNLCSEIKCDSENGDSCSVTSDI